MAELKIDTNKKLDNNLSQSGSEHKGTNELEETNEATDALESVSDDVFDIPTGTKVRNSIVGIPLSNKMNRMNQLTMEGPMDRPRSFSDASLSSRSRQGVLIKLHRKLMTDYKTPMKVFVKRESRVLDSMDEFKERTDAGVSSDAEFGFYSEPYRNPETYGSADNLLDNKASDTGAPAKPVLPQNYRKYLNEQLKHFHQHHGKNMHLDDHEIPAVKPNPKTESVDRFDTHVDVPRTRDDAFSGPEKESDRKLGTKLRRGRSSVSDLPMRSSGPVYKHFDAQFQSQLLRKELEKLRKMKHVRKNSETMKHKFESILRPKSTGDLHVRFADEVEEIEHIETPTESKVKPASRHPFIHSNSADFYTSKTGSLQRQKYYERSKSVAKPEAVPQSGASNRYGMDSVRRNSIIGTVMYEPRTMSSSRSQNQDQSKYAVDHKDNVLKDGARGSIAHESRSSASGKGLGQYRSRSATVLQRSRESERRRGQYLGTLGSSHDSEMSRSMSNLRRQNETIRKYNYGSVEQQREHVRERFQKEKMTRVESLSPDDASINLERELQVAKERLMMLRGEQKETGNGKSVSDNRSDEEKYAALSRGMVVHNKSSSLDSKESDAKSGKLLDRMKYDRMRLTIPDSRLETRDSNQSAHQTAQRIRKTAYVKPHVNTSVNVDVNKSRVGSDNILKREPEYERKGPEMYVDVYKTQRQSDLVVVDGRKLTKGAINVSHDVPNIQSYKDTRSLQTGVQDQRGDRTMNPNPNYHISVPNRSLDSNINSSSSKGNVDALKFMVQSKKGLERCKHVLKSKRTVDGSKSSAQNQGIAVDTGKLSFESKGSAESSKLIALNKGNVDTIKAVTKPDKPDQDEKISNPDGNNQNTGKVVLRQCRVGADVVFGLVAVQDPQTKVGHRFLATNIIER